MKRLVGVLLALILAAACATALATGTYAVGTRQETLTGDHIREIIQSLEKNKDWEKLTGQEEQKVASDRSDTVFYLGTLKPPEAVYATSINNRVSLNWKDNNNVTKIWAVYEKVNNSWKYITAVTNKFCSINKVSDGEHTYGVASVQYSSTTGDFLQSDKLTCVTLLVLNGSDKPGEDADVREISLSGRNDKVLKLTVYDNTYLHIRTDSLTWFADGNSSVVVPETAAGTSDSLRYASLGKNLYVKAAKHKPYIVVATYDYTQTQADGKTVYLMGAKRAYYTIYLDYVSGNAPVMINGIIYQVDFAKKTATATGVTDRNVTKVSVPGSISVNGKSCKVTKIAANAFKGLKKLKTVTIGKNIKTIGKNAFNGCKNLKTITIKTTQLTSSSVKSGAFKNCHKEAVVKCPDSKRSAYKKILSKKGLAKTVKYK